MYTIYFYPDSFFCISVKNNWYRIYNWKCQQECFTICIKRTIEKFWNFVGELVFVINTYMWIEFGRFPNGEPGSFFLNYEKRFLYNSSNSAYPFYVDLCNLWHCVKVVVPFDSIQVRIFVFAHLSLNYVDTS